MTWENDRFIYTVGLLRLIARERVNDYKGVDLSLAEYRGDFDRALRHLNKQLSEVVEDDIEGGEGMQEAKARAYERMCNYLNMGMI